LQLKQHGSSSSSRRDNMSNYSDQSAAKKAAGVPQGGVLTVGEVMMRCGQRVIRPAAAAAAVLDL
jgi:hypothetical protein